MPTRNVNLTDHFDKFITRLVAAGEYSNASEVVRDGLRLIEERRKLQRERLKRLRNGVEEGAGDASF
jgi:antitoxin ParD1/3/4